MVVALLAVAVVFLLWYPAPLAQATGVTCIFLMLLAIDVIIGPLFTLLVYKHGKKTLKFDLAVIIVIQLSAFIYGFYCTAQGRPAWIIFNVDRFELVRVNEILEDNIRQATLDFQKSSWFGAQYAAVQIAQDTKQRNDDMFAEVLGGVSLAQKPERYIPLAQVSFSIKSKAQALNELEQFNSKSTIQEIMIKYPQANAWLPLKANAVDMVVLINKDTGQVVKIVDLRPWK